MISHVNNTNGQTVNVYEAIKKKIDDGSYLPSERLREVNLAEEYNVSRNTIKKVLLMLETDAYVTIEPNKGARVRSYSKTEVLEFMALREVLEVFVVGLAAPIISDAALNKLKDNLEQMEKCLKGGNFLEYSAFNQHFHDVIYAECPNRMAVETLIKLKNQMRKYNSKSILIPERRYHSLEEHRGIFDALVAHDSEKARELTQEHIRNVKENYDKYYDILF